MKTRELIIVLLSVVLTIFGSSCAQRSDQATVLTAPTVIAESGQTEWDLTVMGDSNMWLSFNYYSKYFEEDLGVSIIVHDETVAEHLTTLRRLQRSQRLRDLISESEIVVFNVPFVNPEVGGACVVDPKNWTPLKGGGKLQTGGPQWQNVGRLHPSSKLELFSKC